MRQLEIIVRQVDETGKSQPETEALRLTFEALGPDDLQLGQALDQLEREIATVGADVLRPKCPVFYRFFEVSHQKLD